MREIIRDVYDSRAGWFDMAEKALSLWQSDRYMRESVNLLKLVSKDKVLEVGCGTGATFPFILEQIGEKGTLVGIDISERMLDKVKIKTPAKFTPKLIREDARNVEFPVGYFDAAICNYTLTTIPGWEKVLDDIISSLKPDGRLVISDDILPSYWFLGPHHMVLELLKNGLPSNYKRILAMANKRLRDVKVKRMHFGLIYMISGVKK